MNQYQKDPQSYIQAIADKLDRLKKADPNTRKLVNIIYLMSLAEVLNHRLVMQKLDSLMIKNYIASCSTKYNPPS